MTHRLSVALATGAALLAASSSALAQAPSAPPALAPSPAAAPPGDPLPEITITANRVPTSAQRTGSAITVLSGEEVRRGNPGSLVDALRAVPGLDITETGGPGAVTAIRLRGANAGQTLVLLDGVRVNDSSGASGEFDASLIAPGLVERIEVLRGPQSALYGSDAIGGVVNIITKRGRGAPVATLSTEAGRYGTLSTVGSVAGSGGPWSYAATAFGQRSDGFSRYGYRIGRLERAQGPFETDGYARFGGQGRVGYDAGEGFRVEVGVVGTGARADYDAAFGRYPDTPSLATRRFQQVSAKAELDALGGSLTHTVRLFANRTERSFFDPSYSLVGGALREARARSDFDGARTGAEYQGLLRLREFGSLIFGAKLERETADGFDQAILPLPGPLRRNLAAEQTTASGFGLWQLPVGERLTLSLGGRVDAVSDAGTFATYRATAAYAIPESGTKLRASVGTGAKAPTLFQRFSPLYGTADLAPERSLGVDAGVDQALWGGRASLSLTAFANRLRDLIDFRSGPPCAPERTLGCYVNVSRASTSGLEASGRVAVVEDAVSLSGAYTYLHAKDLSTNLTLARRPQHVGRVAVGITPAPGWLIEPSVVMVSERFSSGGERGRLAPYARLDVRAEAALSASVKVHARVENLTNARYQEVLNYGTTGRALYGGVSATW